MCLPQQNTLQYNCLSKESLSFHFTGSQNLSYLFSISLSSGLLVLSLRLLSLNGHFWFRSHLCICTDVFSFACMCVSYAHVCIHICMCLLYAHIYICIHLFMCIFRGECACVCSHELCVLLCIHVCAYMCMYDCVSICIHCVC